MKLRELLSEATFRPSDMIKVCQSYGSLLGKTLGSPFVVRCTEHFERPGEAGTGVRMMNVPGHMIRLNFSETVTGYSGNTALVLSSVDYWSPVNKNLERPDSTCSFLRDVNVIKIWKKLCSLITGKKYGEYTLSDLGVTEVSETIKNARPATRKQFLNSKDLPEYLGDSPARFRERISNLGLEKEWNDYVAVIKKGVTESNTTEQRVQKAETEAGNLKYKDPDVIFRDLINIVQNIKKSSRRIITVCGASGMGKTHEVRKALSSVLGQPPNKDWVYLPSGKFTVLQFFQEVYRFRDRIICFDEADNILLDDEIVVMLKSALDTSGDNECVYNTGTKRMTDMTVSEVEEYCRKADKYLEDSRLVIGKGFGDKRDNVFGSAGFNPKKEVTGVWTPSRFVFSGKMIFISNLPSEKIDRALLNRGPRIEITLSREGRIRRVQTVMESMGYTDKEMRNILKFLNTQENPEYISVRTVTAYADHLRNGGVSPEEAARLAVNYG